MGAGWCDALALGGEAVLVGAAEAIQIDQALFKIENITCIRVVSDVGVSGSLSLPLIRVRGGAVALQHAEGSRTSLEVPVKGSRQTPNTGPGGSESNPKGSGLN